MLLGSVTALSEAHRGETIVVGSHGGALTGHHALRYGVASLICHDAGIGLEEAGVQGLAILDRAGVPAAAIGHDTARIGDPHDMVTRGIVSRANACARRLGVRPTLPGSEAYALLRDRAAAPPRRPEAAGESAAFGRYSIDVAALCGGRPVRSVVVLDSASSVTGAEDGAIVITGSHGGLPGNAAELAIRAVPFLAVFNDAGRGIDDAGIGRLPVLDGQDIAAACVDARSARIGDGCSTYETGIVSVVNRRAATLGIEVGMAVHDIVQMLACRSPDTATT